MRIQGGEDTRQLQTQTREREARMLTRSSSSIGPLSWLVRRVFCFLGLLLCTIVTTTTVVVDASWQDSSAMTSTVGGDEAASLQYYTSYPIFAPGGRLLSIEKCMQDIQEDNSNSNVVIAIRCGDGLVVVTTLNESPYLTMSTTSVPSSSLLSSSSTIPSSIESSTTTTTTIQPLVLDLPDTGIPRSPFTRLSTSVWGVTAGRVVDSQLLRIKLQRLAEELSYEEGQERQAESSGSSTRDAAILARRLADAAQWPTQSLASPNGNDNGDDDDDDIDSIPPMPLAACALILTSNTGGSNIWRVDPTGHFYKCRAAVVGRQAMAVESQLIQQVQQEMMKLRQSAVEEKRGVGGLEQQHHGDSTTTSGMNDAETSSSSEHEQQQQSTVVDKAQFHQYMDSWTCQEALVAATRSIQAILVSRRRSGGSIGSKSTMSSNDSITGIRLQGLLLTNNNSKNQQEHTDARWYTDQELKEFVVQAEAAGAKSSSSIEISPPMSSP